MDTNNPTLAEISSALNDAMTRRDLAAMAKGTNDLALYAGNLLAALVACVPIIRTALDPRTEGISTTERMQAEACARAICKLTGIDVTKEGP